MKAALLRRYAALQTPAKRSFTPANDSHGKLSNKELTKLYHAIEAALPEQECRIVQFASCYEGEGAKTIGMELAIHALDAMGHHALFIGVEEHASKAIAAQKTIASLNEVARGTATIENAIAKPSVHTAQCDYAYIMATAGSAEHILPYLDNLQQIFTALRETYDLIVFHASGILTHPMGINLARLTDGVVLVLEAERTRAPAAHQAVQLLKDKGIRIIGLAFNKRRYYIPHWLYRWL
jgi:Mrp family chromosome partitioning ATPase